MSETDTIAFLAEMNRNLVSLGRSERVKAVMVHQCVGDLIDAAVPIGAGEYIVPGESIEDLRELVFGARGDVDA